MNHDPFSTKNSVLAADNDPRFHTGPEFWAVESHDAVRYSEHTACAQHSDFVGSGSGSEHVNAAACCSEAS